MSNQINTRNTQTRTDKINTLVDTQTSKILEELDSYSDRMDTFLEILGDRVVESSDCNFAIALARIAELKLDSIKKRTDLIKTLVVDKGNELTSKKRMPTSELDAILSGASLGAALGATLTGGNIIPISQFETINVENAEIIVETEHFGNSVESSADKLIESAKDSSE